MTTDTAIQKDLTVDALNEIFAPLDFQERLRLLYEYFDHDDVLCTSSFGTKSAFLLHHISQVQPSQKVHFIDTTYHFAETLTYKKQLSEHLGLEVIDVLPEEKQNALTRDESWWSQHPRMCCTINKIAPLEPIVKKHKIWIAGLISWQTDFRARLRIFEHQGDIIKFHPLIDISEGDFLYHFSLNQLPKHPLEKHGYGSIGCTHCTKKGQGRTGRWQNTMQSECGLHPNYFLKQMNGNG
ncbi:MAG: phosphoadenylyl-sulfate reductase, partial [Saprospiraceae bacterium]|nr:phosphoadenylyl-sulfate reductase [Saprospiraceae bacterium]